MTGPRIAGIVASVLVVAITLGLAAAVNDAWRNTERDYSRQPFDTVLCDVQRSETPPEDPELFWILAEGVYSYGFEEHHRGCVLHQGRFVERQRSGNFFESEGTYRSCEIESSFRSGGTKTASGKTIRGRGMSSDTGTCRIVLTELIVADD